MPGAIQLRSIVVVLALSSMAAALPAAAQDTGRLTGYVLHALTLEPLAGAVVGVAELDREAVSGEDGGYTLENLPAGTVHVTVHLDGFVPAREEVTVTLGTLVSHDLQISPELHYSEVVSVSPQARDQFESYQPTSVLAGQNLSLQLQTTIGATLEHEPGVSSRSFGAGSARPVIRGFDGDRVLILQNGQRMGDLSSQSADHGVTVNPASASRLEVVRGPATLLYGANAIGGLVNVITDDIPTTPVTGATGSFTVDAGSGAGRAGGAGDVTVGNGRVALHVSGSGHRTGDYGAPGGDVPNSFTRGGAAQVGLSLAGADGYVGGSFAYDDNHYGVPFAEDGETSLTPRRQSVDIRTERQDLPGVVTGVRASYGYRRYRHDELDGGQIATRFSNDTHDVDVLASLRPVGRLTGSIGVWAQTRSFASTGEEALAPPTDQTSAAAFAYEEIGGQHVTFQFGGRAEYTGFTPQGLPARSFTTLSGSVGLMVRPTEETTLAFSLARAARNPALEELYNHGPHVGNFAFEIGDATLDPEHGIGVDAAFRWRHDRASGEVTYFLSNLHDFIYRRLTGQERDGLPVAVFAAGDGRLQGVESHLDVRLTDTVSLEGAVDYVRGQLTSTEEALPRMPPLRGRLGVRYRRAAFQAGGDLSAVGRQHRVQGVETPTGGYQLVKLFAAYSFTGASSEVVHTVVVRLDNATNARYRNHLSFLKDLAPEMGRDFKVLYKMQF